MTLKGITVILIDRVEIGKDPFGASLYEEKEISVNNVITVPVSSDDVISQLNLTGRKAVYILGIPKSDKNSWEDREVIFFNKRWRTFGIPLEGIEDMIPLKWNKKVMVERYE